MTGLFFPFLLIISATLYAFKTRKCPGGFNETRFILFTNCINTILWLAFVPLYLVSTDHKIRAVILAYSLSLSGIVQLGCLVFPKLYTVLFKVRRWSPVHHRRIEANNIFKIDFRSYLKDAKTCHRSKIN